jgi:hypothetical protein
MPEEEDRLKGKGSSEMRRQEALQGKAQHGLDTDDIRQVNYEPSRSLTLDRSYKSLLEVLPLGKSVLKILNLPRNWALELQAKSLKVCLPYFVTHLGRPLQRERSSHQSSQCYKY